MPDMLVSFADVDAATAGELAQELADALRQDVPEAQVEHVRDDPLSQDFGATLAVAITATAVTALAKGIAKYLALRRNPKLVLKRKNKNGASKSITLEGPLTARNEQLIRDFLDD